MVSLILSIAHSKSQKRHRVLAVKMAGKPLMHAVQYNSYGGGAADLKVHLYSLLIFLFSIYNDFGMLSCSYA